MNRGLWPKKYFEPFPISDIKIPPGYLKDDLDDLPPAGKRRGPNRYFDHIRKHGQWKQGIQGYLASIHFADTMVGRVMKALENGPHRDNTIVVLWSDHGWHLGEKQHWQKFTPWRVCTRVPLIIRVPPGMPGLASGTTAGTHCDQPVNLLSLLPTLVQLAGLPEKPSCDGPSLVPLLQDPAAPWSHVSTTFLNRPNNYAISGDRYRYIHYSDGGEELYDVQADPFEWTNLAQDPKHAKPLARMRQLAPQDFAKFVEPTFQSLPKLAWQSAKQSAAPPSRPNGKRFNIVVQNLTNEPSKSFG